MAKLMNMETLVKKLKTVSNTQDSIPMLSLWVIHHKNHHKMIVDTWLDMLKKSKNQHRLTLLYLCNDVVQNCNRKNSPVYRESFADVLAEAVTHLRDSSIRSNVQRVVKIWAKRGIYDSEFTDQLLAALITNRAPEKLRNKLLVEYKTSNLIDEIKKFKDVEDEIESSQNRLKAIRMDMSSTEAIKKLKDKIGGEKFSKDFEESASQLEMFLGRYEKYIEQRKALLDLLDQGTVYYHAQYHEAKIVVNAYKNFEGRVNKMKRGLDKVKLQFPSLAKPNETSSMSTSAHGEDMEMSDDDKELGSKPSKIVAMDTKPSRTVQKTIEKPAGGASGEMPSATENVLKLLASGLESIKNSNEPAAESLKRVVSGLVNRPGMRGASSNASNADTSVNENVKGSLTIMRPVPEETHKQQRSVITTGVESPPSPTGSPELNISSPPRHQSLESRLADIFSENASSETEKNQNVDAESDSDSDTDLIKRANHLLNIKPANEALPGLGNLDQVKQGESEEETVKSTTFYEKTDTSADSCPVTSKSENHDHLNSTVVSTSSSNQTIPVIGSLARMSVPLIDGSSTPTLDEDPYTSAPSIATQYTSASQRRFLSPPHFSGDALSFLTKFMGNATKTEFSTAQAGNIAAAANVNKQVNPPTNVYDAWPPVPSHNNSNIVTLSKSSTPPPPMLPPPAPDFSWPPNADTILPPPWQQQLSSATTASVAASYVSQSTWTPAQPTSNTASNLKYPEISPPTLPKPSHQPFRFPSEQSHIPQSNVSVQHHHHSSDSAPNAKRSKLQSHDTDYRSNTEENLNDSEVSTVFNARKAGFEGRRTSNLITLSTEDECPGPSHGSTQSNYEPMSLFKRNLRSNSLESRNPPNSNINHHNLPEQSKVEVNRHFSSDMERRSMHSHKEPFPKPPESILPVAPKVPGPSVRPQFDEFSNHSNDISNRHVSPRMERPGVHSERFRGNSHLRPPFHDRPHSLRPRFPPPERLRPRPEGHNQHRFSHQVEDEIINMELRLLVDERRREEELLREAAIFDNLPPPRGRPLRGPVPRLPPRSPHFRPRMARPPRFGGVRHPPGMRF